MSTEVKLTYPLEHEGGRITKLNCRRIKVKDFDWIMQVAADLRDVPNHQVDTVVMRRVLAKICGVSEEVVGELDAVDFAAVRDATGFTEAMFALGGGAEPQKSPTS